MFWNAPMRLKKAFAPLMILCSSWILFAAGSRHSRTFTFTYDTLIKELPANASVVRVWIPVALSDEHQTVALTGVSAPVPTRVTREPEYGDRMLYAEMRLPRNATAEFRLTYTVTRKEYSHGTPADLLRRDRKPVTQPPALARFLQPDQLVPTDGRMKELSLEVGGASTGTVTKARAAYEYLFRTMRYDKSGTGWGRGDAVWACDAKRGNCTDFHSPFIAMTRAAGIPARFLIGFPLPEQSHAGEIPGYHCWAEFYLEGTGWVPVDISEAWKNPAKHDYFFGSLDDNRVQFSAGRDIKLNPPQAGPPLNYFVYPYVEVDGRPYGSVENRFSFKDES